MGIDSHRMGTTEGDDSVRCGHSGKTPAIHMLQTTTLIALANGISLILGASIAWIALRAYRRTGIHALGGLSMGMGLVTLGMATGGFLHQFTSVSFTESVAIQSVSVAAGFAVLMLSLVINRRER